MSIQDTAFRCSVVAARIEAASLRPPFGSSSADLVSLAMGEPDFDTPFEIVEAAVHALRTGHTRYVDPFGDPELRERLAEVVSHRAGAPYKHDQILVTQGSSAGLGAAIMALVSPGDRVVIPEPTYSLYADLVAMAGGEPIYVPLQSDFHLDFDRLRIALEGARLLLMCTPGNPTGAICRQTEWEHLATLITNSDTFVLSDEAYATLVYDGFPFISGLTVEALRERLVYVQTFSKTYAMTGWRIGYVAGPAAVVRAAGLVHRAFNGTGNAFVQRAALTAINEGDRHLIPWLEKFHQRRTYALGRLRRIEGLTPGEPEGGFYIFVRYDVAMESANVVERLAAGGVAVRAGREYGPSGEGYFRLSFATGMEQLALALDRMAVVFSELRRKQ